MVDGPNMRGHELGASRCDRTYGHEPAYTSFDGPTPSNRAPDGSAATVLSQSGAEPMWLLLHGTPLTPRESPPLQSWKRSGRRSVPVAGRQSAPFLIGTSETAIGAGRIGRAATLSLSMRGTSRTMFWRCDWPGYPTATCLTAASLLGTPEQ
jgi:hypothetical protein